MPADLSGNANGASRSVSRGLMRGLEQGKVVPGQRLVETDLAAQYGVGRNAVREAIQWLAAQGMIDVSRFRSPAIRRLEEGEAQEVLDAAEPILGLTARTAARNFRAKDHAGHLAAARAELESEDFARARRHFYGTLLAIGGNRELPRLFRVSGLQILYAQYRYAGAAGLARPDLEALAEAVGKGDPKSAEAAAKRHVEAIRKAVTS